MATLRELKTRIGSVSSSEKITGAMKMISSAKVHKNEQALRRLLPFREQIQSVMAHLASCDCDFSSPLMERREIQKVGIVVYGSDDGLCGAYNINIFKSLLKIVAGLRERYGEKIDINVYPVGRKIAKAVVRLQDPHVYLAAIPTGVDSKMNGEKVTEFTSVLRDAFLNKDLDMVGVAYMRFKSMSKQVFTFDQLFPVDSEAIIGESGKKVNANQLYIFEPAPNRIFNEVLPMFVISTMQEITIENRTSEQAARVMAMQSANDNARKLLEQLQLEYNKLRQQSITTELLDILGGQTQK